MTLAMKKDLRTQLRHARASLPAAARAAASGSIRQRLLAEESVRRARTVFCFVSRPDEVDTHALIEDLRAGGRTILVPRIAGAEMLAIEFPGWSALEPGTLGIPAPVSDHAFEGRVDVVITPGVGFTAAGDRLGMGKGYYDRWFAAHDYGLSIAICFECQLVNALPVSETDVPVDLIVTEQRVIRTAR
ncbi:MAG TPA: 5-formyltetrahydrofolate cyclo-ligase [Gammaproteobacteria bacterium]|jgi:5-formyltetrahydrofolate cyclo-ligase